MRGVHLFMFILLLPAIAALGYDLYLFYGNQDRGFMLSTPGYLWTHADEESYKATVEMANDSDPRIWPWLDYVLAQKTVYVGLAFAGFFYVILGLLKILGVWPFRREGSAPRDKGSFKDQITGKKAGKMKYNRK